MRARLALALTLALMHAAPAARAQGNLFGYFSRDCATPANLEAQQGELHAVKVPRLTLTPDILFDATASGGGESEAVLLADEFNIQARWRTPVAVTDRGAVVVTLPNEVVVFTTDFSAADSGVRKPQLVGAMDTLRPLIVATPFGYEVRFRPLRQQTPDEAVGCAAAGSPSIPIRPIIGYNIYRMPGSGTPTLAQYRSSGWVGFADVRSMVGNTADVDGLGCSDGDALDETRLINPNGILDDGDEILVFSDVLRTPGGVLRANVPSPASQYTYRVQPVLFGDINFHASGGTISSNADPVSAHDRDGNGTKESINLLADGRDEYVDPSMHGLGLTWSGQILSSPQPGQATPGPALTDPDGDGVPSSVESALGLNPSSSNAGLDTDSDGPSDVLEAQSGAHPMMADSDLSGERDGRELSYGRSPMNRCDDIVLGARPLGDVAPAGGGDGVITVADAVRMLRLAVTIEFPTETDLVVGDIAPAELTNAGTVPPTWRRHGVPDGGGQHPFGYYEHGDIKIDVADAVLVLRQSVGLLRVTD